MPKDVQMLLVDPTDHLKQFMKNNDFQGNTQVLFIGIQATKPGKDKVRYKGNQY